MYSRKYSLNKPYFTLKYGETLENGYMLIKYLSKFPEIQLTDRNAIIKQRFEAGQNPLFCIIISNKFSKKSTVKNKLKRAISKGVEEFIKENKYGWFVLIPKKRLLGENAKIAVDVEKIGTETYSLLSKVVII